MTICPIAIAVGCKKCPAFEFCPLTTVLGDQQEEDEIEWSAGSTNTPNTPNTPEKNNKEESKDGPLDEIEDEYQRYAEEELEKNTKQMESFKGEDAEVIPERKKLTKDERLALIKKSEENKSVDDID
jgi:hypothetical protein